MSSAPASAKVKRAYDPTKHCGAKRTKRGGSPCTNPKGMGTVHPGYGTCKLHGGSTPSGIKAAAKEQALDHMPAYGEPREIDPYDALLEELHRTAGIVGWLGLVVAQMQQEQLHNPVGGGEHSIPREEPHVWVRLYQEERAHMLRAAKACVDAGIDERRVQLAEQQGAMLALVIRHILGDLDINPNEPRVREVIRARLTEGSQQLETGSSNGAGPKDA